MASTAALLLSACTNSSSSSSSSTSAAAATSAAAETSAGGGSAAATSAAATGEKIKIGFSAPAADHGWMGSITKSAVAEAESLGDVDLVVAEGTNDVNLQISQVETFINDGVDAIVLLPFDGAAMTDVATKAMDAGIPVINVDRGVPGPTARQERSHDQRHLDGRPDQALQGRPGADRPDPRRARPAPSSASSARTAPARRPP